MSLAIEAENEAPSHYPQSSPPGESNFIKQLVNFDKDNISDRVLKKIGHYCTQPDFHPEIIGRVSLAAKSLCMWVRAMEVRRTAFPSLTSSCRSLSHQGGRLAHARCGQ